MKERGIAQQAVPSRWFHCLHDRQNDSRVIQALHHDKSGLKGYSFVPLWSGMRIVVPGEGSRVAHWRGAAVMFV